MRIGFTGTRDETTCEQHHALCSFVKRLTGVVEWHHGACVGADAEGVEVARNLLSGVRVVAHPPDNDALVSFGALDCSDVILDPLPHLDRNHAIVEACDLLVACPKGPEQAQGSGTWATVKCARKLKKHIVIVWPDGTVTEE
jgi:hypothetical protein